MKRRTLKQLGTATCDASELAATSLFSIEEVRLAAIAEQARRDEALQEDPVERQQPDAHPPLDDTLVGTRLEVCWKYSHNGALRKQDLVGLVPFLSDLLSDMYMHYIVHYIALHSALHKTA